MLPHTNHLPVVDSTPLYSLNNFFIVRQNHHRLLQPSGQTTCSHGAGCSRNRRGSIPSIEKDIYKFSFLQLPSSNHIIVQQQHAAHIQQAQAPAAPVAPTAPAAITAGAELFLVFVLLGTAETVVVGFDFVRILAHSRNHNILHPPATAKGTTTAAEPTPRVPIAVNAWIQSGAELAIFTYRAAQHGLLSKRKRKLSLTFLVSSFILWSCNTWILFFSSAISC
jgi:hypothetical protein